MWGNNETTKTIDQKTESMVDKEGKYLTFALANEEYGIAILKVLEIITMAQITRVPRTSDFTISG